MLLNKTGIKIFILYLLIFLSSYPFVYDFTDKKITQYNDKELVDRYNVTLTIKYNSLNNKFTKIEEFVSDLNNEIYIKRRNLKVSNPDIYRGIIKNDDNVQIGSSGNFLVLINLSEIYFQVPYQSMKEIVDIKTSTENMKNQDNKFCKEIKSINTKTLEIDSFHFTVVADIEQVAGDNDIKDALIPFKKCFEYIMISKQKIMIEYLKNFYLISSNKKDQVLDQYINQNSGALFPENKKTYLKKQISIIPELFFSDLEKNFFIIKYTGPYNLNRVSKYARTFNIYSISIVLSLLISFLVSYPIYFFRNIIKLLK